MAVEESYDLTLLECTIERTSSSTTAPLVSHGFKAYDNVGKLIREYFCENGIDWVIRDLHDKYGFHKFKVK